MSDTRPTGGIDPTARIDYDSELIAAEDVDGTPLAAVARWYDAAVADDRVVEPGAMVVATVDASGAPNARTVLLKGLDARGLVFYTGTDVDQGRGARRPPAGVGRAALAPDVPAGPGARQVEQVSREDATAYFTSRPRGSQVAAWASAQSRPLAARDDLVAAVAEVEERFDGQDPLPLPDFWGGYRVRPVEVELWAGQRNRLHDRWVWTTADGQPAPLDDLSAWRGSRRQP